MRFNIELKVRHDNSDEAIYILENSDIEFVGIDDQTDTYFNVSEGRLKLRQGNVENALIFYKRPDVADVKQSDLNLCHLDGAYANDLSQVLIAALGVKVRVQKRRRIYMDNVNNVKIHVDHLSSLGSFVEIEAINVNGEKTVEELTALCDHYIDKLKLDRAKLEAKSYSDLLLETLS